MGPVDQQSASSSLRVHLIDLVTGLESEQDTSTRAVSELLGSRHLELVGESTIAAGLQELEGELQRVLSAGLASVVIVLGTPGLRPSSPLPENLRPLLDFELPGVSETLRRLAQESLGASASFLRVLAGLKSGALILCLPRDQALCSLAIDKILLPSAGSLSLELERPDPRSARVDAPGSVGLQSENLIEPASQHLEQARLTRAEPTGSTEPAAGSVPRASSEPAAAEKDKSAEETEIGWKGALNALGAVVLRGVSWELPAVFEELSAAREVLASAGGRAVVRLGDGSLCGLFGFPDLARPVSKVILVGEGEPLGFILALHRFPRWVGVPAVGREHPLPGLDADPEALGLRITGKPSPRKGQIFAVDGHTIYIAEQTRIWSWDGRRERDEGRARSVLASLLLAWSGR